MLGSSQINAESVSPSESLALLGLSLVIDSVQVSDLLGLLGQSSITETASLSDALSLQGMTVLASELVSISDLICLLGATAITAESVQLSELVTLEVGGNNVLVLPPDSVTLSELVSLLGSVQAVDAGESLGIAEHVADRKTFRCPIQCDFAKRHVHGYDTQYRLYCHDA